MMIVPITSPFSMAGMCSVQGDSGGWESEVSAGVATPLAAVSLRFNHVTVALAPMFPCWDWSESVAIPLSIVSEAISFYTPLFDLSLIVCWAFGNINASRNVVIISSTETSSGFSYVCFMSPSSFMFV
jgi:hypothetical protein